MADHPTGTVTFLFTDIEGSTMLWEHHREWMERAHKRQEEIIRDAVARHDGYAYKMIGDAFQIAFATAVDALAAALGAQQALEEIGNWKSEVGKTAQTKDAASNLQIKVRMALHTGVTEERGDDYVGPVLNRAARLMSGGHGGQILLSEATEALVRDRLPSNVILRDLGERRLRDLTRVEHIYQVVSPDLPSDFPPLKTLDTLPNNLPIQLTSFIGREKESAEIKRLLSTTRLLTLTGAGGCGKTRLSLQLAADSLDGFKDGVWFVDLAPLSNSTFIAQTIAAVFDLRESGATSPTELLKNYLRQKNLLLILDNCEHLIQACAEITDALLHACPDLKILATSREALSIAGETSLRVPSLSLPDPQHAPQLKTLAQSESVRLFTERASAVQSYFQLTNSNAPTIAQICWRLDGIPLAIELAAVRVKSLSVEEIASRLDDRFQLLTSASRTAVPRQQTLRAAIDWSYNLLSESEQTLFRRLSVFAGGWILQAAEAIGSNGIDARAILDLQSQLVDKSLVIVEEQSEHARYRFLETVRQYAREKLLESGEDENIRNRHLEFFLKFAEDAEPKLVGAEGRVWLDRVETEHDNLRLALDWSLSENRVDKGLRITGKLYNFWFARGYWSEVYQRTLTLLRTQGADKPTIEHGKALLVAGESAYWLGHFEDSHTLFEKSIAILREVGKEGRVALELALNRYAYTLVYHDLTAARAVAEEAARLSRESGNLSALAYSLNVLGNSSFASGDFDSARQFYEASAAKYREIGEDQRYVGTLSNLGMTYLYHGDFDKAKEYIAKSIEIAQENGMKSSSYFSLLWLGNLERVRGHYDEAEALFNQDLDELERSGGKTLTAYVLAYLGRLHLTKGNYGQAREHLEESLTFFGHRDFRILIPLEGFAFLASALKQPQRAARLFGAAEALREKIGTQMWPIERAEYEPHLAAARAQLEKVSFNALWNEGRAMTMEQAIEFAQEINVSPQPAQTETPIQTAPDFPANLTAREVDVLKWLARGLTNEQIAEQLVISPRTVNAHLRSIFDKLDVTTRTAAVHAAAELKIV